MTGANVAVGGMTGVALLLTAAGILLSMSLWETAVPSQFDRVYPIFFLGWLPFISVGALLAARRTGNPVGWLLLTSGLLWQLHGFFGAYRTAALFERTAWPGAEWTAWVWDWSWAIPLAIVVTLGLVFPSGRLLSRRWWAVCLMLMFGASLVVVAVALRPGPLPSSPQVANPLGATWFDPFYSLTEGFGTLIFTAGCVGALSAPIARYRRSNPIERQQLRWFVVAGVVVIGAFVLGDAMHAAGTSPTTIGLVRVLPLALLPLAIAAAIFQYRLFDIDIVIEKSLVYGGLAAAIGGSYVAVVLGVGQVFGGREDTELPLLLAATAVAAFAFAPMKNRLEIGARRLVYGKRGSPYEALASFTSRMEPGAGEGALMEMARTITSAVGAESGEVWLRVNGELRCAARWPQFREMEPVSLQPGHESTVILSHVHTTYPVLRGGRLLGALALTLARGHRLRPADDALLRDLASAAWLLLDNTALIDELRASRMRLVTAQDNERARIERDLHDGAQQRLLELALVLRRARAEAESSGATDIAESLNSADLILREALRELREFARGIHPAILRAQGLVPALESLAERAPLPVRLRARDVPRLSDSVEAAAYFAASEALTNVIKHARASTATLCVTVLNGTLRVTVMDEGIGGADPSAPGLQGMADRIAALGGRVRVVSGSDFGTRVEIELPCE